MNIQSDIGLCVRVLFKKEWGKNRIGNKLHSRWWWENRLKTLLADQTIIDIEVNTNPGIYNADGTLEVLPVRFEDEMGWTEETSPYWLGWVTKAFMKRYEHEATTQKVAKRIQQRRLHS